VLAEEAVEKDAVNRAYLEEKVGEAEQVLADAATARKQAAQQKLNDFKALLNQVGG
jgi:hypothetical protein